MFSACLCHLARETDSRLDISNALFWESQGTAVFNFSSLMPQAKNLTGFQPSSFFHNLIIDILLKFFSKEGFAFKVLVFCFKGGRGKKTRSHLSLDPGPSPCFISLDQAKWASLSWFCCLQAHSIPVTEKALGLFQPLQTLWRFQRCLSSFLIPQREGRAPVAHSFPLDYCWLVSRGV